MKELKRSIEDRRIWGVCGGIGEYLQVDSNIVRVIVVVLGLMTAIFPFAISYLVIRLIVPEAIRQNDHVKDATV